MNYITFKKRILGFTLIELMIVVAIVGVLSAIAIPSYIGYIRRSYLSEATTSIASIKSAEESYYTINNCYISVGAWPSTIPNGSPTAWDTGTQPVGWGSNALGVRPDKYVRFQYQVYASNSINTSTGGCGSAATAPTSTDLPCLSGNIIGTSGAYVNTNVTPAWYIVVARGNLDGNSAVNSMILSAIDDSAVVMCNELR